MKKKKKQIDFNPIDTSDVLDIHKYLVKRQDIK